MSLDQKRWMFIIVLMLEFMVALIFGAMNPRNSIYEEVRAIGGIAILCGVVSVCVVYFLTSERSGFFYFVIFCYFFSFGQCILAFLGYEIPRNIAFTVVGGFFSAKELHDAAGFALAAIALTCVGYCLVPKRNLGKIPQGRIVVGGDKITKVAWWLLFISIIPTMYLLYRDIIIMARYGYAMTLENATGIAKIFSIISGLFTSALLILYLFEKKHRKILWIIIIGYVVMQILGGSRLGVFRLAITLLVISDLYRKEIDKKRWMGIILGVVGASFVLSLVSSVRSHIFVTNNVEELIVSASEELVENNFLVSSVLEMGNTQIVNTLVYNTCPEIIDYHYGMSLVKMIWGIIPNFIGNAYQAYVGVAITFKPLYTRTTAGMGASFISEGYWNYGYGSVIYFLLFGMFYAFLVEQFRKACNNERIQATHLFMTVYLLYYFVFLVRGESLSLGRNFVYYVLVPVLLCKITLRKEKNQVEEYRV